MEDMDRIRSEWRWFIGTCIGLVMFVTSIGYFWYRDQQKNLVVKAQLKYHLLALKDASTFHL